MEDSTTHHLDIILSGAVNCIDGVSKQLYQRGMKGESDRLSKLIWEIQAVQKILNLKWYEELNQENK